MDSNQEMIVQLYFFRQFIFLEMYNFEIYGRLYQSKMVRRSVGTKCY